MSLILYRLYISRDTGVVAEQGLGALCFGPVYAKNA